MANVPFAAGGSGHSVGLSDDETLGLSHIRMTGAGGDAELVTITGIDPTTGVSAARVYELDTAADPGAITVGNVRVNLSGGATAAQTVTALVAAINDDARRSVNALDIGGDIVALAGRTPGNAFTITESLVNGLLSHATAVGSAAAAHRGFAAGAYTVLAENVTAWALGVTVEQIVAVMQTTSQPTLISFQIQNVNGVQGATATMRAVWTQVNATYWALVVRDPSAVMSATDVIRWSAIAATDGNN